MRKPRDFDAELKALDDKAKRLRQRKVAQLGDLVIATGADALPAEQLAGALLDAAETSDGAQRRRGTRAAPPSFAGVRHLAPAAFRATARAMHRVAAARNRLMLARARHDTRDWQVKRRERTRQLIELGGLIAKAGLVELTDDDRAVILGLLDEAAAKLRGADRDGQLVLWRRRGRRAFEADEHIARR